MKDVPESSPATSSIPVVSTSPFLSQSARWPWLTPRKKLWIAIIIAHIVFFVGLSAQVFAGGVEGDLGLYRKWSQSGFLVNYWPGLDYAWVYPSGALAPLAFANLFGPTLFLAMWLLLTFALNIASFFALLGRSTNARRLTASWWWLTILIILSPVALLRLDGITAPMIIIALVYMAKRPRFAGFMIAAATWIKVWPAAFFLAMLTNLRQWRRLVIAGIVTSVVIIGAVVASGGGAFLFSFISAQGSRNLQLEAPITTPWLWLSLLNVPGFDRAYGIELATWEVTGPGAEIASSLMNVAMASAVLVVFILLIRARLRQAAVEDVMLMGAFAFVAALIVFNKVGSPQYMLWLAPIIAVALTHGLTKWRFPALLMLAISVATTLVFPVLYMPLIYGSRWVAILLTLRNLMLMVLLGWSLMRLYQLGKKPTVPTDTNSIATHAAKK
jgi:hypothetical protein